MPPGITTTLTAIGATSLYLLRRRMTSKWIDMSSSKIQLHNKVTIITGGNVGLGYETAKDLARRKGTIILGCRDTKKGEDAVSVIQRETGNDNVECMELDLGSLDSVREFSKRVSDKYPSIDNVICNAGVWVPMERQEKTRDGYEIHCGVNHLGHFLLVQSLLPALKTVASTDADDGSGGRVVVVSSSLMKSGKLDLNNQDFVREGRKAEGGNTKSQHCPTGYADSKLMNALFCQQLAKHLQGTNVTTYAVCPGWCYSSLGRNVNLPFHKKMAMLPVLFMFQRSCVQGSQNIVFAAIEDRDRLQNGGFYRDGKIDQGGVEYMASLGEDVPLKLWDLSERLVQAK